ncbi:MAG: sugar phosphate isomerase/epimerase [Chloroflexota bacterium]|nr:sugar phosphate isomerase/epimerase [Chloroflexota bacterium]
MLENVVGAQLYTVRGYTQNLEGVAETLEKVADIGYSAIQISGFGPVDANEVAKIVEDNGLTVASTHTSWDRFLNDLDGVIEEHRLWDCDHPAIGGLPASYRSLEGLERFVDELAPIAERLAEAGMDFSYHNHNHEFVKYGDKTWLEMLCERTDPDMLKMELDVYWVQAGGADPALWVKKCAGREPLLHLKDMIVTPEREQRFAEIGEGNLNWPAILEAAREGGVEWYLVEQDQTYDRDPFESLAISYRNLQAMGLS